MFKHAQAVWPHGMEREKNLAVCFIIDLESLYDCKLYITASTFYRLFVNGTFVSFGPARAAQGYARVDVVELGRFHHPHSHNSIRIEVVGYYCHSLSTCLSPSFLCAEIRNADTVIAYTGRDFTAYQMHQKEQCVQRYSVQRHFGEVWNRTHKELPLGTPQPISEQPVFLPRVAPYPHYEDLLCEATHSSGTFAFDETLPYHTTRYSWADRPSYWGFFEEDDIQEKPFVFIQRQRQTKQADSRLLPLVLQSGAYALFDFSRISCGFLQFSATASEGTKIVIGFSEYCERETFTFTEMNCQNVLQYTLAAGDNHEISFEPYTLRFAVVMVVHGSMTLSQFGIKTFCRDMTKAKKVTLADPRHQKLYDAAARTFSHNAVDIFTDCPSRERAGWLCDSYFMGCAEHFFMGEVPVEEAFLENYRLCRTAHLPKGMLPMCYPSDIKLQNDGDGLFIPQWCMWYVLEVSEYLTIRNSSADASLFRDSVMGIVRWLSQFENEDGLLEDLPSWNFVEWSTANAWTKNVNYPTNFLYAGVLSAVYQLYGEKALLEKSRRIAEKTAERSFDGVMFTDNAVRNCNGILENTGNSSEACQYYAILFGNVDLQAEKFVRLQQSIYNGFADGAPDGRDFVPVNAFIGLYLRLKALLKLEEYDLLLDNVVDFFGEMADLTGTLWEYRQRKGSFDHGFASYAAYAMCQALQRKECAAESI